LLPLVPAMGVPDSTKSGDWFGLQLVMAKSAAWDFAEVLPVGFQSAAMHINMVTSYQYLYIMT